VIKLNAELSVSTHNYFVKQYVIVDLQVFYNFTVTKLKICSLKKGLILSENKKMKRWRSELNYDASDVGESFTKSS